MPKRRFPNNGQTPNELTESLIEERTDKSGGVDACWKWIGYKTALGYGRVMSHRRSYLVHRLALHFATGFDLNSPLCVCHHCDNPSCVNPKHLFAGSVLDNTRDMIKKGRKVVRTGENAFSAKLTEEQMREIFTALRMGERQSVVADNYGITRGHVCELNQGKYWKELWREFYEAQ